MEKFYISPTDFPCSDDRIAIQTAVDAAFRTDLRVVVIPPKKNGTPWHLEDPVLLPNRITVILNGSKLLSDKTAFQNENAEKENTKSLGGEQSEIVLVGTKGAVLESAGKEAQIVLSNVKDYRITGLAFRKGGGIRLHYARYGKVTNVSFLSSEYGIRISEGCNNNLFEDVNAVTEKEALLLKGGRSPMFGRGIEMAETIISRIQAETSAPAIRISSGPCETYNLIVKDVTATADTGIGVVLGDSEDEQPLIDVTVRGIQAKGVGVVTKGKCDGLYVANTASFLPESENTRCFFDRNAEEPIALPKLTDFSYPDGYLTPNDPAFWGDSDAETLQNAVNAAARRKVMLLIPRRNERTGSNLWTIDRAIHLPEGSYIGFLAAHLRQADFCYDNLFFAENTRNLSLVGCGDSVLDGGTHNQLKERNAPKYGLDIRCNATVRLENVRDIRIENLRFQNARWYSIFCAFCERADFSSLAFTNHPFYPDLGGIQIRSGCRNFRIENLSGIVGEDLILLKALEQDGIREGFPKGIFDVQLRNLSVNVSRCTVLRMICHDGHQIQRIRAEGILDPSLPEEKKLPWSAISVGSVLQSTKHLCRKEDLSDLVLRDVYSRADRILELGGNSSNVTFCNAHGFGSCDYLIQTRIQADSEKFYGNALFFRCIQGSRYMRGTATSSITDKNKYIGHSVFLENFTSTDTVLENLFVEKNGEAFKLTGGGTVEVRNFQIQEWGRNLALCSPNSTLILNGETMETTAFRTV